MASHSQILIMAALILTIAIPISKCQEVEGSRRFEDLCSETRRSNECQNILNSKLNRLAGSGDRAIAGGVAELAIAKSKEIYDRIFQYYLDCGEEWLKAKYLSCAINHYDANCNLELARRALDFDQIPEISDDFDDAEEELMSCGRELGEEMLDAGRVGDANEEIGLYLDMARAAAARVPIDDEDDDDDEVNLLAR